MPIREVLLNGRSTTLHGDPSYGKMLIMQVGQGRLHDESVLWKDVDHAVTNSSWVVRGVHVVMREHLILKC